MKPIDPKEDGRPIRTESDDGVLKRPEVYLPKEGDTDFERGFKEGAWFVMESDYLLKKATNPPCFIHVFSPFNKRECVRCGKTPTGA